MRVLFLMFVFPDMDKGFNMYTALVEEFIRNNHEVCVIAPNASTAKTQIRLEKGIEILRVKTLPIKNVPNYFKGISNLLLPSQYYKAIKKYYPDINFDLVIAPTPPITLVDLVSKLKSRQSSKLYLILRDIFPQNAVDLGMMNKRGIIYKYFRYKERKLYSIADHIGCMSSGNIEYIVKHNPYLDKHKLHILHNLQILNKDYPKREAEVKTKYKLENKFVVVFGGNMGKSQQLENVLTLAENCEGYKDVVFLLLGDGLQKLSIEKEINRKNIHNIIVISTIPKPDYQKLISVCDIGLISLHQDFTIPNIPSKTLDYFNLGVPVLASIDRATDYGAYLDEANAGLWSYAGDHSAFKENFDKLYFSLELREELGKNGRAFFEKYLTPGSAYQTIVSQLHKDSLC
jgi:glycosyltransferase involved in cell wall biosynthesis